LAENSCLAKYFPKQRAQALLPVKDTAVLNTNKQQLVFSPLGYSKRKHPITRNPANWLEKYVQDMKRAKKPAHVHLMVGM
jgi:hypothetical protein